MKKPLLYIGSVLIFILAAVAFVFVPAKAGGGQNGAYPVFGKYDGKPIELKPGTDFATAVNNYSNFYRNQGVNLDEQNSFYLYNMAFNAAIVTTTAREAEKSVGYKPSKKSVSRNLLRYYSDETGKYSSKIYSMYSDNQKEELRKNVEKDLVVSRFNDDIFGSETEVGGKKLYGIKSSDAEIAFLKKMGEDKRAFNIVSFSKSSYPESEIKSFAEGNKELFDKFDISAITISDEATAKKVQKQLAGGEISFDDAVAEEYSEKNYTDAKGKVTAAHRYQVKGILADESSLSAIESLSDGAFSDVVKTASGWTVFRKDGKTAGTDFETPDGLDVAKRYITSNESGRIEDYFVAKAKDYIASAAVAGEGAELPEGAESFTTKPFPLNYGSTTIAGKLPTDVAPLAGADRNENFWEKAFKLKAGEYSEPLVIGNYVVVLRIAEAAEDAEEKGLSDDALRSEIANYDSSSAQSVMTGSKKVENNVLQAYFKMVKN